MLLSYSAKYLNMKRKVSRPHKFSIRLNPQVKAALEARAESLWISSACLMRLIIKNWLTSGRSVPEGLSPGGESVGYTIALSVEEEAELRTWAGHPDGAEFARILRAVLVAALSRKQLHI